MSPLSIVLLINCYDYYEIFEERGALLHNIKSALYLLKEKNIKPSGKFMEDIFFNYDIILLCITHLHLIEENNNLYLDLYNYLMTYNSLSNKTINNIFYISNNNSCVLEIIENNLKYDKMLRLLENESHINVPFIINIFHELFNSIIYLTNLTYCTNYDSNEIDTISKIKNITETYLIKHINDVPRNLMIEWCVNIGLNKVLDQVIFNRIQLSSEEAGLVATTLNIKYINELILSGIKFDIKFWETFHSNWYKNNNKLYDFNPEDLVDNYIDTYETILLNSNLDSEEFINSSDLEYMFTRFMYGPRTNCSIDWNSPFRNKKGLQNIINYYVDHATSISIDNFVKLHKLNIFISKEYIHNIYDKREIEKIKKKCKNVIL
jgi:hypothetical protein